VRWELTAEGDQVRLILVHSRLSKGALTMLDAGWQTFLDRLAARLWGRSPGSIETAYAALEPAYEARLDRFGNEARLVGAGKVETSSASGR